MPAGFCTGNAAKIKKKSISNQENKKSGCKTFFTVPQGTRRKRAGLPEKSPAAFREKIQRFSEKDAAVFPKRRRPFPGKAHSLPFPGRAPPPGDGHKRGKSAQKTQKNPAPGLRIPKESPTFAPAIEKKMAG